MYHTIVTAMSSPWPVPWSGQRPRQRGAAPARRSGPCCAWQSRWPHRRGAGPAADSRVIKAHRIVSLSASQSVNRELSVVWPMLALAESITSTGLSRSGTQSKQGIFISSKGAGQNAGGAGQKEVGKYPATGLPSLGMGQMHGTRP